MPSQETVSAYSLSTNSRITKSQRRYILPEEFVPNAQIESYLRSTGSRRYMPMKRSIVHEIPETPPDFPSSDLLKALQHTTASYYTARGLMGAKKRTASRKQRSAASAPVLNAVSESSLPSTSMAPSRHFEDLIPHPPSTGEDLKPDMYLMLDGSALVALGVFVQEWVQFHTDRHMNDQEMRKKQEKPKA